MENIRIIFFGSTSDSVVVLEKLFSLDIGHWTLDIVSVVTQPPRPVGRTHAVTPTPVETWAKHHKVTVLSFSSDPEKPWLYTDETQVIDTLQPFKANLLISASYGLRIPIQAIQAATFGGLNVHPSLLPRWRGADPVPWAILAGDHQTGVTIVTLSKKFDQGRIIAQKKLPMTDRDTSDPLRTKLFALGADLLIQSLPKYLVSSIPGIGKINSGNRSNRRSHNPQRTTHNVLPSYARRLTRDDGFIPWELLKAAIDGIDVPINKRPPLFSLVIGPPAGGWSLAIARLWRALHPWPGIWTKIQVKTQSSNVKTEEKRLKILSCHLQPTTYNLQLDLVQLEGKKPVTFDQFKKAYVSHIPS